MACQIPPEVVANGHNERIANDDTIQLAPMTSKSLDIDQQKKIERITCTLGFDGRNSHNPRP